MSRFRPSLSRWPRSSSFDAELADLLEGAAVAHELTLTCELLFVRFADRVIPIAQPDRTVQRLIERVTGGGYAIVDRYASDRPDGLDHYTVTVLGAQYLGPDAIDRDGMRLTFGACDGVGVRTQKLTRRADRLAEALEANPGLSLLQGCRCIEFSQGAADDPAAVIPMLESHEPMTVNSPEVFS